MPRWVVRKVDYPPAMSVPPDTPGGRRFILAISGASGAAYSLRLLDLLLQPGHEVHLVVTDYGRRLLHDEADIRTITFDELVAAITRTRVEHRSYTEPTRKDEEGHHEPPRSERPLTDDARHRLIIHPHRDVGAVIASGSFIHHGMVVLPASSQSLAAIATGAGSNLLVRAAHVTLKERRPLIVCHRETPLSLIDIENMRTLTLAGAIICPTNPGFYLHPRSTQDLVDFIVGKVLDLLHVPHALNTRWESHASGSREL